MKKRKWVVGSPEFNEHRLKVIERKYGTHAFEKWGKGTTSHPGGSPILNAWKRGKIRIVK